jgi:hypothetical protein
VSYELGFDLACDVGLKFSPRQLFRFPSMPLGLPVSEN